MEPETLFDLKARCHERIDDLVALGMSKNQVYKKLFYFLKCKPGEEHIARVATMTQARRILGFLGYLKQKQRKENARYLRETQAKVLK